MASRPKGSLDDLAVPKGEALVPAAGAAAPSPGSGLKGYAHTLSLRLTADQYRQLRRYVARQEEADGGRVTHQSVIETALTEFLAKGGG